jgi:hypothetical protein
MKFKTSSLMACIAGVIVLSGSANAQQEDPWSIYGDARVRAEFNDTEGDTDRHRMRMRLRTGARFQASETLMLNVRLVTGDADKPGSTNQDAGDGFHSFPVSLDRLHFDWAMSEHVNMLAGKFANPIFRNPVYGGLVWDSDVSPEGLSFISEYDDFNFSFGQYAVSESSTSEDAWMSVASIDSSANDFTFGASYSFYGDMNGKGIVSSDNRNNALSSADAYLDAVVSYKLDNFTFAAEMIENLRADDSVDASGLALGVLFKAESGDKFYIQHQSVDQDAVFTGFSQNDTLDYASNYEGQVFGYKTKFENGMDLHAWGMAVAPSDTALAGSDETEYRFRIDFSLNF